MPFSGKSPCFLSLHFVLVLNGGSHNNDAPGVFIQTRLEVVEKFGALLFCTCASVLFQNEGEGGRRCLANLGWGPDQLGRASEAKYKGGWGVGG